MANRDGIPSTPQDSGAIVHATCVATDGRGVLIIGASGSGKSALALMLLTLGAGLVADDRVTLTRAGDEVIAGAPASTTGLIEARGIGLLNAAPVGPVPIELVVDLDERETARLPEHREIAVFGRSVTLLRKVDGPHFPHAIIQYLKAGRQKT